MAIVGVYCSFAMHLFAAIFPVRQPIHALCLPGKGRYRLAGGDDLRVQCLHRLHADPRQLAGSVGTLAAGTELAGIAGPAQSGALLPLQVVGINRYDPAPTFAAIHRIARSMVTALLWLLVAALPSAAPDTLVVCPDGFRPALASWENYRREQGHVLAVVEPPATAAELQPRFAEGSCGSLKYVVLIGDVPVVPTNYVDARINVHWGSEPTIATDQLYADVDGDGSPDVAVGRIPADTPQELAAFVRKVLRYEQQANSGQRFWATATRRGGRCRRFRADHRRADRSGRSQRVSASRSQEPRSPAIAGRPRQDLRANRRGSFAWIYLGHGLPTMLVR